MATKIIIKHSQSGMIKQGCHGFSWTYLFWGWIVPLVRGELGIGGLHLLFTMLTMGLWQFIVCFLYNKQYMTRMLTAGWELTGSEGDVREAKMALNIVG